MKMIKKKLLNQIKNASKNNKKFLITKFSQPAKELTEYLIENKMIEGVCKKNNLMIIFLSYSITNKPVIKETSILFKELTPQEKITNKNFAINWIIKSKNKKICVMKFR